MREAHVERFRRGIRRRWPVAVLLAVLSLDAGAASAGSEDRQSADQAIVLTSGPERAHLLELYTSEGCSSCPPADRWIGSLAADEGLWERFVPVAFHVTYWNYLGWRDDFSDRRHDARQRRTARRAGSGVYTPGVFRDGAEWLSWRRGGRPAGAESETVGVLSARLDHENVHLHYEPAAGGEDRAVLAYVAWLSGASTEVRRGENRGRRLRHEFTVRRLDRVPLPWRDGRNEASLAVMRPTFRDSPAVAVWVEDRSGRILQATGGWLPHLVTGAQAGAGGLPRVRTTAETAGAARAD